MTTPLPLSDWSTGQPSSPWVVDIPSGGWSVGYDTIGMSHLSTEYVIIPVNVTKAGAAYDPTNDVVQFAFMPTQTQVPQSGDWIAGIWEEDPTSVLYPYLAQCLVGPSGTTTLTVGLYVIYLKITDNPEIPVLIGGQLEIT
jgi:hypothetical protein